MNYTPAVFNRGIAEVAEQADAHDSKSCSLGSVGSIPTFGMNQKPGWIIAPPGRMANHLGVLNRVPLFYSRSQ